MPGSVDWADDLPLCLNHNKREPLIRLGTAFRVLSNDVGLWVEVDADAIEDGETFLHGARHGRFRGWSVSFAATRERWDRTGDHPLRSVERARLLEISIVDRGAHATTIDTLAKINLRRAA